MTKVVGEHLCEKYASSKYSLSTYVVMRAISTLTKIKDGTDGLANKALFILRFRYYSLK